MAEPALEAEEEDEEGLHKVIGQELHALLDELPPARDWRHSLRAGAWYQPEPAAAASPPPPPAPAPAASCPLTIELAGCSPFTRGYYGQRLRTRAAHRQDGALEQWQHRHALALSRVDPTAAALAEPPEPDWWASALEQVPLEQILAAHSKAAAEPLAEALEEREVDQALQSIRSRIGGRDPAEAEPAAPPTDAPVGDRCTEPAPAEEAAAASEEPAPAEEAAAASEEPSAADEEEPAAADEEPAASSSAEPSAGELLRDERWFRGQPQQTECAAPVVGEDLEASSWEAPRLESEEPISARIERTKKEADRLARLADREAAKLAALQQEEAIRERTRAAAREHAAEYRQEVEQELCERAEEQEAARQAAEAAACAAHRAALRAVEQEASELAERQAALVTEAARQAVLESVREGREGRGVVRAARQETERQLAASQAQQEAARQAALRAAVRQMVEGAPHAVRQEGEWQQHFRAAHTRAEQQIRAEQAGHPVLVCTISQPPGCAQQSPEQPVGWVLEEEEDDCGGLGWSLEGSAQPAGGAPAVGSGRYKTARSELAVLFSMLDFDTSGQISW